MPGSCLLRLQLGLSWVRGARFSPLRWHSCYSKCSAAEHAVAWTEALILQGILIEQEARPHHPHRNYRLNLLVTQNLLIKTFLLLDLISGWLNQSL